MGLIENADQRTPTTLTHWQKEVPGGWVWRHNTDKPNRESGTCTSILQCINMHRSGKISQVQRDPVTDMKCVRDEGSMVNWPLLKCQVLIWSLPI